MTDSSVDYDVISYRTCMNRWSLDDVGLDREAAVSHLALRAFRWDEWNGAWALEKILRGADPLTPVKVCSSERGLEPMWLCIVPEDAPHPPFPVDD